MENRVEVFGRAIRSVVFGTALLMTGAVLIDAADCPNPPIVPGSRCLSELTPGELDEINRNTAIAIAASVSAIGTTLASFRISEAVDNWGIDRRHRSSR